MNKTGNSLGHSCRSRTYTETGLEYELCSMQCQICRR